jgi:uncharacterized membrane protein (DUF106 family)
MSLLGVTLPVGAELIIIAICVVYTLGSVALQRKLTNPKRMREVQARVKQLTNEMNLLAKSNATKEMITAKQNEMMPLMSESMRTMMKPMFVVLPIFLVLYYVMLPALAAPLGVAGGAKSVQLLFFTITLVLGLISTAVILMYDRMKMKQESVVQQVDATGYKTQV